MTTVTNSISIRWLNIANVNNTEFRAISDEVKSWGGTPPSHTQEHVYKKYILGRWLASELLKKYGVTRKHFRNMALSSLGKPYIPNQAVSFNISHSGNFIICAAVEDGKIGIDIEELRPVEWKQYGDCFSILEWRTISFSDDPHQKLLELWTKKESLLKADGRGLQIALTDVVLEEEYGNIKGDEKKWHFRQIPIKGYTCHVCAEFEVADIDLE
jgi:phosphopantetheinyl transferase